MEPCASPLSQTIKKSMAVSAATRPSVKIMPGNCLRIGARIVALSIAVLRVLSVDGNIRRATLVCLGVLGYIAPVHSGRLKAGFGLRRGG